MKNVEEKNAAIVEVNNGEKFEEKLKELVEEYSKKLDIQQNKFNPAEKEYSISSAARNYIVKIDFFDTIDWIAEIPHSDGEISERFSANPKIVLEELETFFKEAIEEEKAHKIRLKKIFNAVFAPHKQILDVIGTYTEKDNDFGFYNGGEGCLVKYSLIDKKNNEHVITITEEREFFTIVVSESGVERSKITTTLEKSKDFLKQYIENI